MARYKVEMICREISRAVVIINTDEDFDDNLEEVKDKAWSKFDENAVPALEQENYTKVEVLVEV